MNLVPRDTQAEPTHEHHHMAHDAPVEYTCPMHPEVVQDEPGSCPKCGMNLVPRDARCSGRIYLPYASGSRAGRTGLLSKVRHEFGAT